MSRDERVVVGLDVGTTKVCALIAEVADDQLEVIGLGIVPSRGLRKGVVVNTDDVVDSIEAAIQKAEQQSGFKIVSAFVSISGSHICTQTSQGIVAVRQGDRQISVDDVQRALEAARVVNMPADREIIHVLPRDYVVDGQEGIKNPIDMLGHRIEVQTTVVTGAKTSVANLVNCVERTGLGIDSLVVQQLAAGEAALTEAERNLGVALLEMGGGTTDIGVFKDGAIIFGASIPVGGFQITNDVAVGLRIPFAAAEEIKVRHGLMVGDTADDDRMIDVSAFGRGDEHPISLSDLNEIIEPRLEETFELVNEQLVRAGLETMPGGLVLCGGSAQLSGIRRLASDLFRAPVRIATPTGLYGLVDQISAPAFAASVGLLRWGMDQEFEPEPSNRRLALPGVGSALGNWLRNFFP